MWFRLCISPLYYITWVRSVKGPWLSLSTGDFSERTSLLGVNWTIFFENKSLGWSLWRSSLGYQLGGCEGILAVSPSNSSGDGLQEALKWGYLSNFCDCALKEAIGDYLQEISQVLVGLLENDLNEICFKQRQTAYLKCVEVL